MTRKAPSAKRSLLFSLTSLIICVAMLLGTTFAWFSETIASDVNIIKAGNLDVELKYAKVEDGVLSAWDTVEGKTEIFDPNALWEPGRVEIVYLEVSNLGTLDLKYQLGINVYEEIAGINMDNEEFELSDHLVFAVLDVENDDGTMAVYSDREAVALAAGNSLGLDDYNSGTTTLASTEKDYVAVIVYMPETVENEANYRGDAIPTIKFGINIVATQVEAETDSFGPDYDEDAWHPEMTVVEKEDFVLALQNGVDAQLGADIQIDDDVVLTGNLDLGGNTLTVDFLTAAEDVEIVNGTIVMSEDEYLYAEDGVTVTLENVVIDSDKLSAFVYTGGTLVLENVTFENATNSNPLQNYGGTLVLDNVTVKQEGNAATAWYSSAVQVVNVIQYNDAAGRYEVLSQANTTINGGTYEGKKALMISAPGGNVTINGGTFIGSEYAILDDFAPNNYLGGENYESVITINGGNFVGAIKVSAATELVIYGGTFTVDPSAYVASGCSVVFTGEVYEVIP